MNLTVNSGEGYQIAFTKESGRWQAFILTPGQRAQELLIPFRAIKALAEQYGLILS